MSPQPHAYRPSTSSTLQTDIVHAAQPVQRIVSLSSLLELYLSQRPSPRRPHVPLSAINSLVDYDYHGCISC